MQASARFFEVHQANTVIVDELGDRALVISKGVHSSVNAALPVAARRSSSVGHHPVSAIPLGAVECLVSAVQDRLHRIVGMLEASNTNAGRHRH